MKRSMALFLLILFGVTTMAFAHAGEIHSYMGTIKTLEKDGSSFLLENTDGKTVRVVVAKTTKYFHADGHAAEAGELKPGSRVVAKIGKDGKTAISIKMASPKKKENERTK